MTTMSHQPRKRFGQHFLSDRNVVLQLVAAIQPRAGQHIVEIGPGMGVLTEALLPHVDQMDAVELDRDLIPKLLKAGAEGIIEYPLNKVL